MCSLSQGSQPLKFDVLKDGQPIASTSIGVKYEDDFAILTINEVTTEAGGNYTCQVTNRDGSDSFTFLLNVKATPKWLIEPKDVNFTIGSSAKVMCSASGSPAPSVSWRKLADSSLQSSSGIILFKVVQSKHAGMYECAVSNDEGEQLKKIIKINVFGMLKTQSKNNSELTKANCKCHRLCLNQTFSLRC